MVQKLSPVTPCDLQGPQSPVVGVSRSLPASGRLPHTTGQGRGRTVPPLVSVRLASGERVVDPTRTPSENVVRSSFRLAGVRQCARETETRMGIDVE